MCHSRCGPRLSEAAAEKLKNRYVLMRSGVRDHEMESEKRLNIPITVRLISFDIMIKIFCCIFSKSFDLQHGLDNDDSYSAKGVA